MVNLPRKKKVIKMEQRTVKVKLSLTKEQEQSIFQTMEKCQKLFSFVTELCNQNETFNYYTISGPKHYEELKKAFPEIPTCLLQSISKIACASVKLWNKKHKKEQWKCKANKGSFSYPLNKLSLSRRGDLTSICSINGRIKTLVKIPQWFFDKYNVKPNEVQAGQIKHKKDGFFLYLIYKVTPEQCEGDGIIGIDRGLYNLVSLSDGTNVSSKKAISVKRKYQHLRKKLQQKGTRSAKRKLRKRSGREKRFMRDFNHVVTKRLSERKDVKVYVLEDLEGIRKERKGKKLNSWLSNWSYYEFQKQLEYKCWLKGIKVVYVNPAHTSQTCHLCGNVDKKARKKSQYVCSCCGNKIHADINAAMNIRDKYALSCKGDRVPFNHPNVSESALGPF